jgi:AhpC/TSA antioxidant enzyme
MLEPELVDHEALRSLPADRPVLLVCLRHLGCAFAREALADLRTTRAAIEASGAQLVLAHLEDPATARPFLQRYGLDGVTAISDPSAHLYTSCGLRRGGVRELLAPRVVWRWPATAILRRHGAGWTGSDLRRMPGAFLLDRGRIVRAFRHRTTADRPDYVALCSR